MKRRKTKKKGGKKKGREGERGRKERNINGDSGLRN